MSRRLSASVPTIAGRPRRKCANDRSVASNCAENRASAPSLKTAAISDSNACRSASTGGTGASRPPSRFRAGLAGREIPPGPACGSTISPPRESGLRAGSPIPGAPPAHNTHMAIPPENTPRTNPTAMVTDVLSGPPWPRIGRSALVTRSSGEAPYFFFDFPPAFARSSASLARFSSSAVQPFAPHDPGEEVASGKSGPARRVGPWRSQVQVLDATVAKRSEDSAQSGGSPQLAR